METPVMILVSIVSARWVVRHLAVSSALSRRLGIGLVALSLLFVAEVIFVVWLRNMTISEYIASRDPIAGTAYIIALAVFGVIPVFVARR